MLVPQWGREENKKYAAVMGSEQSEQKIELEPQKWGGDLLVVRVM